MHELTILSFDGSWGVWIHRESKHDEQSCKPMPFLWYVVYPLTLYFLLGLFIRSFRRLRLLGLFDHAFSIGSLISIRLVTEVTNNDASRGVCSQHFLHTRFGYGVDQCQWANKNLRLADMKKAWVTWSRSESTCTHRPEGGRTPIDLRSCYGHSQDNQVERIGSERSGVVLSILLLTPGIGQAQALLSPAHSLNFLWEEILWTTSKLWPTIGQTEEGRVSSLLVCVYWNDGAARQPINPWPVSISQYPSEREQLLDGRLHC